MKSVSQGWGLDGQNARWDGLRSKSRVEDRALLKLATTESIKQTERTGARSGDSASEKRAWSIDCRPWTVKEARREEGERRWMMLK